MTRTTLRKGFLAALFSFMCMALIFLMSDVLPKADAATAGTYDVKVNINVTDECDGWGDGTYHPHSNISIYCKGNNGFGSDEYYFITDAEGSLFSSTGTRTYTKTGVGFPTVFHHDYEYGGGFTWRSLAYTLTIDVAKHGSNNYTQVYSNSHSNKSAAFKSASGNFNWNISTRPHANSVYLNSSDIYVKVPGRGDNTVNTGSATVYDNWGVEWYLEPEFCVHTGTGAAASSDNIKGVRLSNTGAADNVNVIVNEKAKDFVGAGVASRPVYVNAYYGDLKSAVKKVNITNIGYTVTFMNGNTKLTEGAYTYKAKPSYSGTPTKEMDAHFIYEFDGWTTDKNGNGTVYKAGSMPEVTSDMTLYAHYARTTRLYNITFKNEDGTELYVLKNWPYGRLPEYKGDTPTKTSTAQYDFVHDGWTPALTEVTGPATYTAKYKNILRNYTVKFFDTNGNLVSEETVPYGSAIPAPPAHPDNKPSDDTYSYEPDGWDITVSTVTGNTEITAKYKAVPHVFTEYKRDEPTCSITGTSYLRCECGYETTKVIPVVDHHPADHTVKENIVPATCTRPGSYEEVLYCFGCDKEYRRDVVKVAPLGHDYELTETIAATCSKGGYEIWTCKNNPNHKEIRNKTAPTGEHTEVIVPGKAPTCLESGYSESSYCSVCGAVIKPRVIILADGHNLIKDEAVIATCTHTGLTEGWHCADCDYVIPQEVVPMLEHNFEEYPGKPATCTEPGYTAGLKCKGCGLIINSTEIPALGHNYIAEEHEATCTQPGYIVYTCANDPTHTYTVETSPALGHTGGKATCQGPAICTRCGEAYGEKGQHNYIATVIPSTCTTYGYTEYVCEYCNDSYRENQTELLPHEFDEGVITLKPTCTQDGIRTFSCKNCNETYTEVIKAQGHKVDKWDVIDGTAYGTCTECGAELTANPEDVGLEIPVCERCGMKHIYKYGIFKYKGIYCSLVYFFRQIIEFFKVF